MAKITLNINDLKTLASETRLIILKALDSKRLSLNDLCSVTNLNKMTLHEHLSKLVENGYVKKHEREGHKWVYYSLSWKGSSILHPENTKILVFFCTTVFALSLSIISLMVLMKTWFFSTNGPFAGNYSSIPGIPGMSPFLFILTIGSFIVFFVSFYLFITLCRNKKK